MIRQRLLPKLQILSSIFVIVYVAYSELSVLYIGEFTFFVSSDVLGHFTLVGGEHFLNM